MGYEIPDNFLISKESACAAIAGDALVYLRRSITNPFRYSVNEIGLSEIRTLKLRDGRLGCHMEIEKQNGERVSIRNPDRRGARRMAETLSKQQNQSDSPGSIQSIPAGIEASIEEALQDEEHGISRLVDIIIENAIERNASDIHIEPLETLKLRYRLDGVLADICEIPIEYHSRIAARVKVMARLPSYEKDRPLDGRIEKDYGSGLDLRVSTFPTIHGDKIAIRIFDSGLSLFELSDLGFSRPLLDQFESLILRPEGTILLTGPTNSGKTTTIYSALERIYGIRENAVNIATIEDPVERDLKKFSQTRIAPVRGLTFNSALRSVLRQDVNVIMVGEIRDVETANTAIRAGMTGHLVITTIHSGTAPGVFARLLEMGLEPFILASSVSGIMAQRLVRRVCPECCNTVRPADELLKRFRIEDGSFVQSKGEGCVQCAGTGYRGRTAIAELLAVDEALREAVLARSSAADLKRISRAGGMTDLLHDGLIKVREGMTTLEELARVLVPEEV